MHPADQPQIPFSHDVVYPERARDGSLSAASRRQIPVPPDSLTWKYYGDVRYLLVGLYLGIIQNMHPQLAMGVHDHSVLVSDPGSFPARALRSITMIATAVYADPAETGLRGLQIRNIHKPIKGTMPDGSGYHAIDPGTYYWAHATFVLGIYKMVDLTGRRRLTDDERRQIFEESKEWFSLYGVDSSAQPDTYEEFVQYCDGVIENQLVSTSVAQLGPDLFERHRLPAGFLPIPSWAQTAFAAIVGPLIRIPNVGAMEPSVRERLNLRWTVLDDLALRAFTMGWRLASPAYELLPVRVRYLGPAASGFRRTGVSPRRITVDSARAALEEARAASRISPRGATSQHPVGVAGAR